MKSSLDSVELVKQLPKEVVGYRDRKQIIEKLEELEWNEWLTTWKQELIEDFDDD